MGYWKRFKEVQNYVHYLLLALIVDIVFWKYLESSFTLKMFGMTYLALFLGDSFVHGFFWILPKKYGRWRD
jgi:hypothetical protein